MTHIILDARAVEALFPEGTPARVELQRTVLSMITRQFVKTGDIGLEAVKVIKEARADLLKECLKSMGVEVGAYSHRVVLPDALKNSIRAATSDQISSEICKAVAELKGEIPERLRAELASQLSIIARKAIKEITDAQSSLGSLVAMANAGAKP